MSSLGKRSSPGTGDRNGGVSRFSPRDVIGEEVARSMDGVELNPYMSAADFDYATVMHIYREVLPQAIRDKNVEVARACEELLAKHALAEPNRLTGRWEPMEVPRNELQVRELFACRLKEYGYRLVCSHTEFPDWLLLREEDGEFVYAEVEHRSSGFAHHGHDPRSCDLIVCWEHDYPDAPLPVLEFFSGSLVEPKHERRALRAGRGGLAVNFSGALSRYAAGEIRSKKKARGEYALSRYEELRGIGAGEPSAVAELARELGITREAVRGLLTRRGVPRVGKLGPLRQEQVRDRVQSLVLSGRTKNVAIGMAAEEFGVKRSTVGVYLSRSR